MRKIPTLFFRDPQDMSRVTEEVNPECQWVIDGEGVATRKYDATCVLFANDAWWARREVKPNKTPPPNFWPVDHDPKTGKTVGWEPMDQSGFRGAWSEAMAVHPSSLGTYELCGPKINGNPEGYTLHRLIRHSDAETFGTTGAPRDPQAIRLLVQALSRADHWEGVVWHHPDGRMAKLKARDFGLKPTPPASTAPEEI